MIVPPVDPCASPMEAHMSSLCCTPEKHATSQVLPSNASLPQHYWFGLSFAMTMWLALLAGTMISVG